MKRIFMMVAVIAVLAGCSSKTDAEKALTSAGYTDIVTDGYSMFGCSDDDSFKTKFTANGPTGVKTTGVVCSGWFKGATIRTN